MLKNLTALETVTRETQELAGFSCVFGLFV
jgi:hypothetical protein